MARSAKPVFTGEGAGGARRGNGVAIYSHVPHAQPLRLFRGYIHFACGPRIFLIGHICRERAVHCERDVFRLPGFWGVLGAGRGVGSGHGVCCHQGRPRQAAFRHLSPYGSADLARRVLDQARERGRQGRPAHRRYLLHCCTSTSSTSNLLYWLYCCTCCTAVLPGLRPPPPHNLAISSNRFRQIQAIRDSQKRNGHRGIGRLCGGGGARRHRF